MNYKLKIPSKVFYRIEKESFKFLVNKFSDYNNFTNYNVINNNGIIIYQKIFESKLIQVMYET